QIVAGDVAGEMAVDADPVVRAVETVTIPLLAGRELRRQPRLLELEEVDASLVVNQLLTCGDHRWADLEHAKIVHMFAYNVKLIYGRNSSEQQSSSQPRCHPATLFPGQTPRSSKPPRPPSRQPLDRKSTRLN